MICLFCNTEEPEGIKPDGSKKRYKPQKDLFICSSCVQILSGAQQDDLKQAFLKTKEKGFINKAEAIKSFLIQEKANVRKTKEPRCNMGRKRFMRKAKPCYN